MLKNSLFFIAVFWGGYFYAAPVVDSSNLTSKRIDEILHSQPQDAAGNLDHLVKFIELGNSQSMDLRGFNLTLLSQFRPLLSFKDSLLDGARLSYSNLEGVGFEGASMNNVDLTASYAPQACFDEASLRDVTAMYANLDGTTWKGAHVHRMNMYRASVHRANFKGAIGLKDALHVTNQAGLYIFRGLKQLK